MNSITVSTPLGNMIAIEFDGVITSLSFSEAPVSQQQSDSVILQHLKKELCLYFSGDLIEFKTPISLEGSYFQKEVWNTLRKIPIGQTRSYKEISREIGCLGGYRAVGRANNYNPIAIIVPCHRVIGANGALAGYNWGIDRKKWLLEHEKRSV